jgi:hypothetical protein
MVEQESHGVREDFAHQPACQVPPIARPHPLYAVASGELRKDGVYPVAKTAEEGTPLRIWISLFGGVGSQKLYAHLRQLLLGLGRVVVSIPDHHTAGSSDDLRDYRELVDVGWGYREAGNQPRPANPHMRSEAIEGLLEEGVLAEGRFTAEASTAVGPGEEARWQGHRVADGEGEVVRGEGKKLLPERRVPCSSRGWRSVGRRWCDGSSTARGTTRRNVL